MKAKKTTISKTYDGDVGTMPTGCLPVMVELGCFGVFIVVFVTVGLLLFWR